MSEFREPVYIGTGKPTILHKESSDSRVSRFKEKVGKIIDWHKPASWEARMMMQYDRVASHLPESMEERMQTLRPLFETSSKVGGYVMTMGEITLLMTATIGGIYAGTHQRETKELFKKLILKRQTIIETGGVATIVVAGASGQTEQYDSTASVIQDNNPEPVQIIGRNLTDNLPAVALQETLKKPPYADIPRLSPEYVATGAYIPTTSAEIYLQQDGDPKLLRVYSKVGFYNSERFTHTQNIYSQQVRWNREHAMNTCKFLPLNVRKNSRDDFFTIQKAAGYRFDYAEESDRAGSNEKPQILPFSERKAAVIMILEVMKQLKDQSPPIIVNDFKASAFWWNPSDDHRSIEIMWLDPSIVLNEQSRNERDLFHNYSGVSEKELQNREMQKAEIRQNTSEIGDNVFASELCKMLYPLGDSPPGLVDYLSSKHTHWEIMRYIDQLSDSY